MADPAVAAQVVGLANAVYRGFVRNAWSSEAQQVYAYPVETIDRLASGFVGVGKNAGGGVEHGAIEDKAVSHGGQSAELCERGRRPVQDYGSVGGRRRRWGRIGRGLLGKR